MTVKDIFKKTAYYLDIGSIVTLEYQFTGSQSLPKWRVVEDGDGSRTLLNKVIVNGSRSSVKLTVDKNFKFGTYTVVDESREYSIKIPYRLGKKNSLALCYELKWYKI